jgi:3-methyladenine DNA glycosylase AlkC
MSTLEDRVPARRIADIPSAVLEQLCRGQLASKNLTEWLAVDRWRLLESIAEEIGIDRATLKKILSAQSHEGSALKQSHAVARSFAGNSISIQDAHWKAMSVHRSDIVREWAALMVGLSDITFARKLAWIKPFADDDNSGLREVAWMALRQDVLIDPTRCIEKLVPWTGSRAERLRRFASELTRPRGVWCAHIEILKENPSLGISILEPLRDDESKYVRDSVGNWLNDAGKTAPQWCIEITERWERESPTKNTQSILKRARRNLT